MYRVISGPKGPQPSFPPYVPRRFPTAMIDRLHDMMRPCMDMQMHCVLTLAGRIDEQRLARAMRLLLLSEPLLSCRWVRGLRLPYWERRSDLDDLPLCTLEQAGAAAADEAIKRYMIQPGDPSVDPLMRVHIVRAEVDTLCIRMDHTAGDGHGMMHCNYTLAELYTKLGDNPSYRPTPNLEGSRSYRQLVAQMSNLDRLRMIRRWWRDQRSLAHPEGWWALPTKPGFRDRPMRGETFVQKRISQERVRAARDFGKRLGMSLNDVLVAAHLKALCEVIQPPAGWPLRLEMMVDLRRYLRRNTSAALCNLSGRCLLTIEGGMGTSFADLALRVRDRMNVLKEDLMGTGCWVFTPLLTNTIPHTWASAIVRREHLGDELAEGLSTPLFAAGVRVDPERLIFGEVRTIDMFANGSIVRPPFFTTALSAFGDAMTLTTGFYESGFERTMVVDLYDRMVDALPW